MASNVELGRRSIDDTSKSFYRYQPICREYVQDSTRDCRVSRAKKPASTPFPGAWTRSAVLLLTHRPDGTQLASSAKDLLAKMQELNSVASTLADMSTNLQQTVGRFELREDSLTGTETMRRHQTALQRNQKQRASGKVKAS
jgi:hypothetical protein